MNGTLSLERKSAAALSASASLLRSIAISPSVVEALADVAAMGAAAAGAGAAAS